MGLCWLLTSPSTLEIVRVSSRAFFIGKSMSNDYFASYQNPLWQKKRLENLQLANYQCVNCGEKDSQLHVHHKQYFKGRNPWEYENNQLEVLCESCHKEAHKVIDAIKMMISYSDNTQIFNLLCGFLDQETKNKSYDIDDFIFKYDQRMVNNGIIAALMDYVHPKYQLEIADFIISLSDIEEEATDFFRKIYEDAGDYDE